MERLISTEVLQKPAKLLKRWTSPENRYEELVTRGAEKRPSTEGTVQERAHYGAALLAEVALKVHAGLSAIARAADVEMDLIN